MDLTTNIGATLVAKEDIASLHFPKEDVLINDARKKQRETLLVRAMKIGNNFKGKVKITFEDNEGVKQVETTIWGVTRQNILLKQTTLIPIRRIHGIKFY